LHSKLILHALHGPLLLHLLVSHVDQLVQGSAILILHSHISEQTLPLLCSGIRTHSLHVGQACSTTQSCGDLTTAFHLPGSLLIHGPLITHHGLVSQLLLLGDSLAQERVLTESR
jgi:hypothetical protein